MVISLYAESECQPLPTMEEVLLCTHSTTIEDVSLPYICSVWVNRYHLLCQLLFQKVIIFWRRVLADPGYKRIFCLVNAEKLPYHVSDKAFRELSRLCQGKSGKFLVMVCY